MLPSYANACNLVLFHFPQLQKSDLPKLKFHGTLKKALAYCYFDKNVILASKKHYVKNKQVFAQEVFLHELAHFVAAKLYDCRTHSAAWASVCEELGIIAREEIEVQL